jgi:OTU domain-containing protein 5
MNEALKKSEEFHLEQTMLDDKLKATDWEATNEEIMELVARESYLQWLKDNEKRSIDRNALNLYCDQMPSTNAQCSTWDTNSSDLMSRNHQHLSQQNQNSSHRLSLNRRTSTSTPPRSPSQSKLSHFKSSPPSQNHHHQQQQQHQQLKLNRNDELNYFDDKSHSANKTKSSSSTSPAATTTSNTTSFTANVSSSNMTTSTSLPTTSSKTDSIDCNNLLMYDENAMQYQYYETKNIINELTPDLFGLNSNDWIGLDSGNGNDSDILAQVLAASQAEYLESLKAKRQQQK